MSPVRFPGLRCPGFGLFLAALALWGQIVLGAVVPARAEAISDRLAPAFGDFPICHTGAPLDPGRDGRADGKQHGMPCALCPLCGAITAASVLPTPIVPVVPLAPAPTGHPALPPAARAPPVAVILAATYPTGPPRSA